MRVCVHACTCFYVFLSVCAFVNVFVSSASTRKQLLDDDAASAIQAALSNFPQQEELQTEAAEVLRKLK